MSLSPDILIDGNYLKPGPIGAPRYEYPFRKNGDRITAHFEQDYWQTKATFVPQEFKISFERDATFYLIAESEPFEVGANLIQFTRTWSRIPQQQIVPGSRFVTKPDLPGEFPQVSGNSLIVQPDPNVPRWVFYTQKAVTSDSGAPNGDNPTGGSYTVTVGASTTGPIAYNASASTLAAAINALTSVSTYNTVTVTGSYTSGFAIAFGALTAGTADTTGMTIFGVGAPQVVLKGVTVTNLRTMRFTLSAPNGYAFASGSTFTITIFGQTTAAIPITATLADIKTALEALSNIGAGNITTFPGLTGSGSHAQSGTNIMDAFGDHIAFMFTVSTAVQSLSASAASLTPTGSTATVATITAGSVYSLKFLGVTPATRILYSAAHGISAIDGILVTQGENFRTIAAGAYSVTTDTIILTSASGVAFTTPTLITAVGTQTGNVYTAGTKLTRVKRVTDYYLPGVSVGIDTIDDIPLPDYEGDAASLLEAIFNGDTDINYEVGELEFYRDGPIVQRTRTTLDASQL